MVPGVWGNVSRTELIGFGVPASSEPPTLAPPQGRLCCKELDRGTEESKRRTAVESHPCAKDAQG